MFSKLFSLDSQFIEWIWKGKHWQVVINLLGISFIFMGHIIVSLNDIYCIAFVVARHCVEHKFCYKGFDQVKYFLLCRAKYSWKDLGVCDLGLWLDFIPNAIGFIGYITLCFNSFGFLVTCTTWIWKVSNFCDFCTLQKSGMLQGNISFFHYLHS